MMSTMVIWPDARARRPARRTKPGSAVEDLSYFSNEHVRGEGLPKEVGARRRYAVMHDDVARIPRGMKHFGVRVYACQLPGELSGCMRASSRASSSPPISGITTSVTSR